MRIHGYPDYSILEDGTIISHKLGQYKILKPVINNKGYLLIKLSANGKAKMFLVHRLVALHYIPNPKNLPYVLHKDDDPLNPHKDNLYWGTQKDNMLDKKLKNRSAKLGDNGNAKTVLITDLDKNILFEFSSIKEACITLSLNYKSVMSTLNAKNNKRKRYKDFRFIKKLDCKLCETRYSLQL